MKCIHLCQNTYHLSQVKERLEGAISLLGGWNALLGGRRRILLKPNLVVAGPPEQGHTTHPAFILAVAELLLDHGFQAGVGDSPGTGSAQQVLHGLGLLPELARRGVEVVNFQGNLPLAQPVPGYPGIGLARQLQDWDGLINLPKLKSHRQSLVTGATKNLFGCLAGKKKVLFHFLSGNDLIGFLGMVQALGQEAGALLHLADGIAALHKGGPIHGEIFPLGSILASQDPLLLDYWFARRIGLEPSQVPLFQAVGVPEPGELQGDPLSPVAGFVLPPLIDIRFNLPRLAQSYVKGLMSQFRVKPQEREKQ